MARAPRRRPRGGGFTTLEVLMALVIVVMVVVFTGRVIVTTFALIGRGESFDGERAARARSQAVAWVQAATEYTRKVGFDEVVANCCSFWISASTATSPYDDANAPGVPAFNLPTGFQCGHVQVSDALTPPWPGADPNAVRLVTVEIYRVKAACADGGPEQPYVSHQTAMADR